MKIDGRKIRDELIVVLGTTLTSKRVCFLQFGENTVSEKFVAQKMKVAAQLGVVAEYIQSNAVTTDDALAVLQAEIQNSIDGIVVQLPVAPGIDQEKIVAAIPVALDIDFLNPESLQLFTLGKLNRVPAVAGAIWKIFETNKIVLENKMIVVLGKGKLVGEPLCALFDQKHILYSVCTSKTATIELQKKLRTADIIISGIGIPGFVQPDMIKDGVVLIDAGTSEQSNKTVGDIDPSCYEKASFYTPVPGGVGPVTVVSLFQNFAKK